ncbi:MAG: flavin reductase family protein [Saprospiraceae bacterium]|nr:flavin reductase family protein [Saprospiraceae bacterium]
MLRIDPNQIATPDLHQFILGAVAPRPIAFASTVGADGEPNLAPYSFFNAFSSNPPILIFSSNRRVRDNTTKDTLRNIRETGEVVINVVPYSIVRQMAIAGVEFEAGVSEFEKAGLTPLKSEQVRPFRVAESPVHMECVVEQILPLGDQGGAGNLIICRIVLMHIHEGVLTDKGRIDPNKIDLMGRMGRFWYARASGEAVYEIVQPAEQIPLGFDALPTGLRHSTVLTGNNLAQLAGMTAWPAPEEIRALKETDPRVQKALQAQDPQIALHLYAKELLDQNSVELGAKVAMLPEYR